MTNYTKNNIGITIKDYSVSREEFTLVENLSYGYLETHPQPSEKTLPSYYESVDYISHTDGRRNYFEKVYAAVRKYTIKRKLKLIEKYASNYKNLLDIGCGTGDFLSAAKANGWVVAGIEPNEGAREMANKKTDGAVLGGDRFWSLENNKYDVITLWHVLEHLPNLEAYTQKLKGVLKEDGVLIVAVPNYKSFDATFYNKFWAAYDVPRHLWHFNRMSISKLFATVSLKVIAEKPMWFDAFYVSMLSEKNKSKKMNLLKSFFVACYSNVKAIFTKEASSIIFILKIEKL